MMNNLFHSEFKNHYFLRSFSKGINPPNREPVIKLVPIIKLIGKSTVSLMNKLSFVFSELFWIPIINIKNKKKLKLILKNTFLTGNPIFLNKIYF